MIFISAHWQDQFDTIDLSDNEIVKLENLPYLNRLGTLLINNNRITRINPNIGGKLRMTLGLSLFINILGSQCSSVTQA